MQSDSFFSVRKMCIKIASVLVGLLILRNGIFPSIKDKYRVRTSVESVESNNMYLFCVFANPRAIIW